MVALARLLGRAMLVFVFVTAFSLLIALGIASIVDCVLNPWAGYTCPAWIAPIVGLALPGVVTLLPAMVILLIYIATRRRNR